MARQQGYIAMIPVFIPVPKNDLKHQVEVGRALAEVIDTRDLSTIISLPGARFHPPKAGKDIITRWTSVEAPIGAEAGVDGGPGDEIETPLFESGTETIADAMDEESPAEAREHVEQDEATTTGRRRRSAA